jgi:hypothetical protein
MMKMVRSPALRQRTLIDRHEIRCGGILTNLKRHPRKGRNVPAARLGWLAAGSNQFGSEGSELGTIHAPTI